MRYRTYELVLPAGAYVLRTWEKPDLHVIVWAGESVSADFRNPNCL